MGVKLLMTYLHSNVQRVRQIKAEGERGVIVFDALGCRERYFDKESFIVDFQSMKKRVAKDVEAFHRAGFKLIVVIDGGLDPTKYATWGSRRQRELQAIKGLNRYLKHERTRRAPVFERWCPPENHAQYLVEAFEDARCEVYVSDQDADHVMAWLAKKRQAYGILTCDTDMLMFPGVNMYMDSNTLSLYGDGRIFVGHVAQNQLAASLGLPKDKLPGIAGILGNDVIRAKSLADRQLLAAKWGVRCYVRAAGKEVASKSKGQWSPNCRRAIEYYTPVEPKKRSTLDLKGSNLMDKKIHIRGIIHEDLDSHKAIYQTIASLCRAVYARNNLDVVEEHMCIPSEQPTVWEKGWTVKIPSGLTNAPNPPTECRALATLVCQYLKEANAISDFHFYALLSQAVDRVSVINQMNARTARIQKTLPFIPDIHASSLFLYAINVLWMGAEGVQPKCWEMFDGEVFHYLCQSGRGLITELWPSYRKLKWCSPVFDWGSILAMN